MKYSILLLFLTGCRITHDPRETLFINPEPALKEAAIQAAKMWHECNVNVQIAEFGMPIYISDDMEAPIVAKYYHANGTIGVAKMLLNDEWLPNNTSHVLAHEIGHSLGLMHVSESGDDIMAFYANLSIDSFSENDKAEFKRATGLDCK